MNEKKIREAREKWISEHMLELGQLNRKKERTQNNSLSLITDIQQTIERCSVISFFFDHKDRKETPIEYAFYTLYRIWIISQT